MWGIITYVHNALSIGTNPTATQYKAIHWTDNTGDSGNNHRLATVEYSCGTDGTTGLVLGPYQYIANRASYNGSLLKLSITSDNTKSITWDGKPVVCVTKWTSGASYYRVYSDGYIEQGGQTASWSNNPDTTITLHKAFSNANYTVSCINIGSTKDGYTGDVCLKSKASSSFVINCHTNNRGGLNWFACGY